MKENSCLKKEDKIILKNIEGLGVENLITMFLKSLVSYSSWEMAVHFGFIF